jgi:hypothetical protein
MQHDASTGLRCYKQSNAAKQLPLSDQHLPHTTVHAPSIALLLPPVQDVLCTLHATPAAQPSKQQLCQLLMCHSALPSVQV